MDTDILLLNSQVSACRICADKFLTTKTAHEPRPVFWMSQTARILIAGQAPGARVHESGRPFTDPSGERLRDWMGIDDAIFYDKAKIAILPMSFCFPGYSDTGSDLPPPKICARTWRQKVLNALTGVRLTLLIGGYAQKWHLGQTARKGVGATVMDWAAYAPATFPLPHPSWRNSGWLKKNPWFEMDLLPDLRHAVREAL